MVHFNFGFWDCHSALYVSGRRMIPTFDAARAALVDDLDQRGLLESTIVLALGEMGRIPTGTVGAHSDYAQVVFCAGGGFRGGNVGGATDRLGDRVADKFYKIESFGRTLYHLLGIDSDTIVTTRANRPIKLIAEEAPIIQGSDSLTSAHARQLPLQIRRMRFGVGATTSSRQSVPYACQSTWHPRPVAPGNLVSSSMRFGLLDRMSQPTPVEQTEASNI